MDSITTDERTDSACFRKNALGYHLQSAAPGKVVIREIHSDRYLSAGGFLASDIAKGKRFDSCAAALEEATRLELPSAELVAI